MMNTTHPLHVLVAVTVLVCLKTWSFGAESLSTDKDYSTTKCIERERKALLVFKHGLNSAPRHDDLLNSWKDEEEDCCQWEGVACDDHTAHVTHLYLSSLIPQSFTYPTNISISPSLLDLPYLRYLDLSSNFLEGLRIPKFIGSLTNLVHLDLSSNSIGSIPHEIGNLSNLQYLNLSYNYFDGPIPKFIGLYNRLRYLDLSNSFFSGVIPPEFKNLSNLQYLNLASNFFGGPIPKFIASLNSLSYLDLSDSCFVRAIPHELGNLSKLQHLGLGGLGYNSGPRGDGNFEWLFNLSSLTHLDLSDIYITPPTVWVSFIQRIPSISFMRLYYCNLSASSYTSGNFSSSISTLQLNGNYINSSIFNWLSHLNGSLVELDLGWNVLEGRIPESFGHMTALTRLNLGHNLLSGPLPNSFSLITALTYLDLSENQLNGVLSKYIGNLSSLQVADFSCNNFTGNLDGLLSRPFSLLQELSISENQLTGSLPDITILPSLRRLEVNSNQLNGYLPRAFDHHSVLQTLDLSNNHLRGPLPNFTGFSSLVSLHLDENEFSGSLPDFTGCSSLQVLRLGENQITEWKYQSTGLLSSLETLDLSKNSIHGTISDAHFSNLSSLTYMSTSHNSLKFEFSSKWLPPFQLGELSLASCKLGPKFPNWIRNQRHIGHLDISDSQISDTIPIWFSNLSSVIHHLNLSSNKIRGKFSVKYDRIEEIDLSSNFFHGPLPPIPSECSNINLSHNNFSGTLLPLSAVGDLSLRFLDLSHNRLFGTLPDNWKHFQGLVFLNLGHNNLSGRIPASMGHLVSLQTLILRNNKLNGELPTSLKNCSSLGFVDFGLNKLSGNVPSWIGDDLKQLYALILKSNKFQGSIPNEVCHLANLHFLDVSINRISGTIPPCFGNLSSMNNKETELTEHSYVSENSTSYSFTDSVLARWKGQEFEYGRNFAYLKMIDLSTNELTGEIPLSITRLLGLRGLNLSRNRLHGKVPAEIGQLQVLECLDLSTNKFSGEIPQSMSRLNFLAYLDVSNNNFSGRIPSGTQLQGFDISTYEGNMGLCGKPLTNICQGDQVRPTSNEYEVDGEDSEYKRWVYISAVLGFSTSFWGITGTLVLNRRWRHAYFFFLYNLKEQFFVAMAVRIARFQRTV